MGTSQQCPVCKSSRVRVGRVRSFLGQLRVLWGEFPARCEDCSARFHVRGVGLGSIFYAQCPHCLRQDLSTWDLKHYRATRWMHFQMLLGAHRWRCEVCRSNFVSLRPRKEKYVRPADRLVPDEARDASGTLA
jgi:hypothetical protein